MAEGVQRSPPRRVDAYGQGREPDLLARVRDGVDAEGGGDGAAGAHVEDDPPGEVQAEEEVREVGGDEGDGDDKGGGVEDVGVEVVHDGGQEDGERAGVGDDVRPRRVQERVREGRVHVPPVDVHAAAPQRGELFPGEVHGGEGEAEAERERVGVGGEAGEAAVYDGRGEEPGLRHGCGGARREVVGGGERGPEFDVEEGAGRVRAGEG